MKKIFLLAITFMAHQVFAQEFQGCMKPSILPNQCKEMKSTRDVESCTDMILINDNEWHAWQECAISVIEKRRVDELQQVLDAAKLARDSRLGFLRLARK